ncbi:hypothetical protein LCGC14_0868550 [marine sediment metagenome]|uniref:Portal protein n=1 Tax=marine sediment metagenome TaxID=412755 RepID=A0A0F9PQZ1_9ZZZZ
MSRPTKAWIFDQLTSLRTHYSGRNTSFDLDDQYYELMFRDRLGLPEEYKEDGIVLPTARDIVDAGTNHVATVFARFLRPMRGMGQEAQEQAEMLRKFDTAMFYRTKMEASISPWRVAARHACTYGMWCFESLYNERKLPDMPEKETDETDDEFADRMSIYDGELYDALPISIRAVHPRNVFPSINGDFMIIEESKTLLQAQSEWPQSNMKLMVSGVVMGGGNAGDGVVTGAGRSAVQVMYMDKFYRAIYVNQVSVLPTADAEGIVGHDYGHVPYVVGFSGLGNEDAVAKPEKQAVGLIRYLRPLLRAESFAYSVYNIVIKAHSWPITFVSGPGAAAIANIKLKFGKIYEKPAGVTIEDYVKAPPPDLVMQHMTYTNAVLSASGAPRSVRGLPEAGVRSGTDRAQIINKAKMKYDSILEQMQLCTSKVMANCTKIAERVIPEDFHLWAKSPDEEIDFRIDRKKIKHHYTTFCEFTSVSPEEEARRHADMMNLVKSGIMSSTTGRRRYLSHIDPEAEDIRVEAERLRLNPEVQQVMGSIVASVLAGEAARLMKIKQLQAGQTPGQPPDGAQTSQASLTMPGGAQELSAMKRPQPQPAQSPGVEQLLSSTVSRVAANQPPVQ